MAEDSRDSTRQPDQAPEKPAAETDTTMQAESGLIDRLDRLERVIRSMARDGLEVTRSQRETQAVTAGLSARLEQLELLLKGLSQTVWRSGQDSQSAMQSAEQHFAVAIRELEARLRDEMQWQIYRNALQAVFPALDDLDLIISHGAPDSAGEESPLFEALVLVRQKMAEGMSKLGLEEIAVEAGKTVFDPTLHQAVHSDLPADLPDREDVPRGTILHVRRAGYRLQDRIFRAPQVIVKM